MTNRCIRCTILALIAMLVVPAGAMAQTAAEWAATAGAQYAVGEYAASADSYQRSIEEGAENPATFFNAACSSALAGQVDAAFERLSEAVVHGWRDVSYLVGDGDLASLHEDPRWKELIADCKRAEAEFAASIAEPELRAELLEMKRIDQAMRLGLDIPELAEVDDVDGVNTARMVEIVAEHGWPGSSPVGEDGASAAWLLVQHADAHPEFQRECLGLMLRMPEGEVSAVDVAYLTDRVLVNEGRRQLYGTQFWTVDGELQPRPIEDEAGLEARRAAAGMISMEAYKARLTARP